MSLTHGCENVPQVAINPLSFFDSRASENVEVLDVYSHVGPSHCV
jgi:hypothetical protein